MENALTIILSLLSAVFVSSLVILVALCKYKNWRKRTAVYVKRLTRGDLSHSDIELINEDERRGKIWDSADTDDLNWLNDKCSALLQLCGTVDEDTDDNNKRLKTTDVEKLRHIVHIANSISEATAKGDTNKCRIMKRSDTTKMLISVSQALTKIDQRLVKLKQCPMHQLDFLYANDDIS